MSCSFPHERLLAPSKLKVLHFAPTPEHVGGSGGWIINNTLPFHHWRLFSPHDRSGHRWRLMASTTEDMNLVSSKPPGLGSRVLHASTSTNGSAILSRQPTSPSPTYPALAL